MKYTTVLFDVDGTLLDSAPGIIDGYKWALRSAGVEPPADEVLGADIGPPLEVVLTRHGFPAERASEAIGIYRERYLSHGTLMAEPYPGVREMLDALAERGVRLATATTKRVDTARSILGVHGLLDYFEVIGGSGLTDRTTKPEIVAWTLHQLGLSESDSVGSIDAAAAEQVLMVGDRHYDVEGGKTNGLPVLGCTWGYGSNDELRRSGADLFATSPAEATLRISG